MAKSKRRQKNPPRKGSPAAKRGARKAARTRAHKKAVRRIVGSTMTKLTKLPSKKTRRKHSRFGSVRCDICAPLRCSKAP